MSMPTFIHISDLHIGLLDEESMNARTRFYQKYWPFEGMLGHSYDSLMDLRDFVMYEFLHGFGKENPNLHLIVTGDLTAIGHSEEFDTVNEYLSGTLPDLVGRRVGLGVLDWRDRAIPGNHDHWPGRPVIFGPPTLTLKRYFPDMPKADLAFRLDRGRQLRLLRIDTDANVKAYSRDRFLAFGNFAPQLKQLAEILDTIGNNDNEVRALCLHHSPSYRGKAFQIGNESLLALNEFILRYRIAVLLCGHIHRPPLASLFHPVPDNPLEVVEVRSGTTTQIDPTIARKAELEGLVNTHWQNSFFIHRLKSVSEEIHWETELYLEGRAGFERADRLRDDVDAVVRFKVWPWPPRAV